MAAPPRPTLPASPWDVIPPTTTPSRAQPKRRPGGLPVALSGPVPPWQHEAPETRDAEMPRVLPAPVAPPETRDVFLPRPGPSVPGQPPLPPPRGFLPDAGDEGAMPIPRVPGEPPPPFIDPTAEGGMIPLPGVPEDRTIGPRDPVEQQIADEIAASVRALLHGRGHRSTSAR